MSGIMKQPKPKPQVIQTQPTIIDNSKPTQELERARKKRQGAAAQFIKGNTSLSGNSVRKTTLGE